MDSEEEKLKVKTVFHFCAQQHPETPTLFTGEAESCYILFPPCNSAQKQALWGKGMGYN